MNGVPALEISTELRAKIDAILAEMAGMDRLVVALSGGVDSSLVAALAYRAMGERATAVTALSETLPQRELEEARHVAREIGIPHELIAFSELDDARFRENTAARCYFCQSMRFDQLRTIAERVGGALLASGTNHSDTGDHRPGLQAMKERGVYQPLLLHGIDKADVRRVARWLGLSVWDKPAKACLSSRIPHGLEVTEARLRRIERGEEVLYAHHFRLFRVRDHNGLARIEVAPGEMPRLLDPSLLKQIARAVRRAGFHAVTVDLAGYRSGSLNPLPAATASETAAHGMEDRP